MFGPSKIYMDHAATTPVDREVFLAMRPYFSKNFYNAGSIYRGGVEAKSAIENSRAKIASILGVRPQEVIFTEGATEANNLIILGLVKAWFRDGSEKKPHIITTEIEHPSVLEVCKHLEETGVAEISYLQVDEKGLVSVSDLKKLIKPETILISVIYANNEIGAIQPIREIAKTIRFWRKTNNIEYPYFHTDAVQAVNYLDIKVEKLGVNMMTINASKIYGPKMIGALYKKENISISPILYGGSQEFGLRPGTENVTGCVGFAKAIEITTNLKEREVKRLEELQKYFFQELKNAIPDLYINGGLENRIPNNINISIPRISGEELILRLDVLGIQASTQSACKSDNSQQSHVIKALYKNKSNNDAVIRFTMGRGTRKKDVDETVESLRIILKKYKK